MLNFRTWCEEKFGITDFCEGKSEEYFIFEGQQLNETLKKYKGIYIDDDKQNIRGVIIESVQYYLFKAENPNDPLAFKSTRYKMPVPIYLRFNSLTNEYNFISLFENDECKPTFVWNDIHEGSATAIPHQLYAKLLDQYEKESDDNLILSDVSLLESQLASLKNLLDLLPLLEKRIKDAFFLSLDYTNENKITLRGYESPSSYALSVKLYAELYRDSLSKVDYETLMYFSHMIAKYSDNGELMQSLKTDSNFHSHFKRNLVGVHRKIEADKSYTTLDNLPPMVANQVKTIIKKNKNALLFGNEAVPLGKNLTYRAARFLPDANKGMSSETNEIIIHSGGMIDHLALFKIIKIGMNKDGNPSEPTKQPFYFDYYKVEFNRGAGCNDANSVFRTCNDTYVRKLCPMQLIGQTWHCTNTDPKSHPQQYQNEMKNVLSELIISHRHIELYRANVKGQNGEDYSPEGSEEAKVWTLLNKRIIQLSGTSINTPITYYHQKTSDPKSWIKMELKTQKGYLQQGGSCAIYSIKAASMGTLGYTLGAMHNTFMQTHTYQDYVNAINSKIDKIKSTLKTLRQPLADNSAYMIND